MASWQEGLPEFDWEEAAKRNPFICRQFGLINVVRSDTLWRNSIGIDFYNAEGKYIAKMGEGYWYWCYFKYRDFPTFRHVHNWHLINVHSGVESDIVNMPRFDTITFFETATDQEISLDTPTTNYINGEVYAKTTCCSKHKICSLNKHYLGLY